MTRKYKQQTHSSSRNSTTSRGGTVLGIFIGLMIGALISLLVVWYMNRTAAPFLNKPSQSPGEQVGSTTPAAPLPGKPGEAGAEKRFQFYDILPGKSEPKPDAKPGGTVAAPAGTPGKGELKADAKATGPQTLQVGSFQNVKDAENLKASLALMALDPKIQEVRINDRTWFRVRIGPLATADDVTRVRNELGKAGMQAALVKTND